MAYNGYYSNRPQKPDKHSPAEDTKGETETFVTRNVKLITFLVCLAIFLVFFGPWSVMRVMDWIEQMETQEQFEETAMTYEEMVAILKKGKQLQWADFDGYYYEVRWTTGMVINEYITKDGDFSIKVTALSEHAPLDSVLIVRDIDKESLELMESEVEEVLAFIQKNENSN